MSRFAYSGVMQDGNGARLADATVSVFEADTTTPASIYAAKTGGAAVASVTTAADGSYTFYVDQDDYLGTQRFDVQMAKAGYTSITVPDIEVIPATNHVGITVTDTTDRTIVFTLELASATTAKTVTLSSAHTDDRTHTLADQTDLLVGAVHGGDATKAAKITTSGATTAKTMNIISSHTDDRAQTLPDKTGTIANLDGDTFTNTTLTSPVIGTPEIRNPTFEDPTITTKKMNLDLSGATATKTATLLSAHTDDRTHTFPDKAGTVAHTSDVTVSESFASSGQTITAAGVLTLAHGLSSVPYNIVVYLKNTSTEHNWATGDEIIVPPGRDSTGNTSGYAMWVDATNVNIRICSTAASFQYYDKTTGASAALDNAKWDLYVKAWA